MIFTNRLFNNIYLIGAFILGMVLITCAVTIPALHTVFQVQPLNAAQLLTAYALALLNLPIIQFLKFVRTKISEKRS